MRAFKVGDRVRIVAYPPHDLHHTGRDATIALIDGPAYGLVVDGMESAGVHKWYVADELARLGESNRSSSEVALSGWGAPPTGPFKLGDRVTLTEYPAHDPYHYGRNATVVKINPGPAYGVLIDGMESMGTHKWYVGDEIVPAADPQKRTIGPVVLVPDLVMFGLGALGVVGSRFIKNEAASMASLMVGAMVGATGLHGTIMRVTQGGLKAEMNLPPPRAAESTAPSRSPASVGGRGTYR